MNMDQILAAIKNIEDTHRLKKLLVFRKTVLESWCDDARMDFLHHAILENNVEAVSVLFACGFFKAPHEPQGYPYMHLAAALGRKTILLMLFQDRPEDNRLLSYRWNEPRITSIPYSCAMDCETTKDGTIKSPLDIAAETNNLKCVYTILDQSESGEQKRFSISKTKNRSYTYTACLCNSPSALRLLLTEGIHGDDIREAVSLSLKIAKPECLDCLLQFARRHSIGPLFAGSMNLYHVLYSYSLSFNKTWYESLLLLTSVLLKHGQNVKARVPFRTYPLYSLLSHSSCHDFENSASYIIACLLLLLNAGADPNFDEIEFEKRNGEEEIATAFGREPFSSAFHCLFQTVNSYFKEVENKELVHDYLLKATGIIISHGGNVNQVSSIGYENESGSGSSLHCYLAVAIGMTSKECSPDPVLKLLLRHGADPNIEVDKIYPVNTILRILTNSNLTKIQLNAGETVIKDLSEHMTLQHLTEAIKTSNRQILSTTFGEEQDRTVSSIMTHLQGRVGHVWSLKKYSTINIIILCKRKLPNILKLPLPMSLKIDITKIFHTKSTLL